MEDLLFTQVERFPQFLGEYLNNKDDTQVATTTVGGNGIGMIVVILHL
jgi:hypothetical protein